MQPSWFSYTFSNARQLGNVEGKWKLSEMRVTRQHSVAGPVIQKSFRSGRQWFREAARIESANCGTDTDSYVLER